MQLKYSLPGAFAAVFLCLSQQVATQVPGFGSCPNIVAQQALNVSRYLGVWYEIYKFPAIFEWGETCISANYTLKDDGHINVDNEGYRGKEHIVAIGDGYCPDDTKPAELLVKFPGSPAYGNYWVVNTDYENYSVIFSCGALFGLAHVEFAWILSRERTLNATTVNTLMDELWAGGVDTRKFKKTSQDKCPDIE